MIEGKGKREKERDEVKCKVQSAKCHCEEGQPDEAIQKENPSALQPLSLSASTFGFLNVYKPIGMTSHDVIAILRRVTKIKQIGHTGTLDPFAQGVLPIAIGKATRLIEYLDDEKEYLAEISFGKSTNTYDCDGEVIFCAASAKKIHGAQKIALKDIQTGLKTFEGEILQTPPIYSAIKVKGKKLYEYARKGEEVEIEPREVFIEKIELQSFDEKSQKAEVLIRCSKGTYIRSIAHDLGQNLGCGAYLSKLIRTQSGKFFVKAAIQLEDIKTAENVEKDLINPLDMLNLAQIEINEEEHKKVLMGQPIEGKGKREKGKEYPSPNFSDARSSHRKIPSQSDKPIPSLLRLASSPRRRFAARGEGDSSLLTAHCSLPVILVYNNNISAVAHVSENLIKVKKVF